MTTVLFACVHNAGRSQMAAAFFNALAGATHTRAISAGTKPADRVHPHVVHAMREVGIDLEGAVPQRLTDEIARSADILVTMGCGETCPVVPGVKRLEWDIQDPKGQDLDHVRHIRDGIHDQVVRLIQAEGLGITQLPPVACTLSPEELHTRRDDLLTGLAARADIVEPIPGGVRLHLPASSDTLATIARVVDTERRCCRFLKFTITVEPELGPIIVTVTAPPDAQSLLRDLIRSAGD